MLQRSRSRFLRWIFLRCLLVILATLVALNLTTMLLLGQSGTTTLEGRRER